MRLKRLEPEDPRPAFTCGDSDLDEYFHKDSVEGGKELLAVTYVFLGDSSNEALAFFSVLNDAIKKEDLPRSSYERLVKLVSRPKRYSSMPAAKIGRLGISVAEQGNGLGTTVIDYLKVWFTSGNKTGCRFLVVDAYNTEKATNFYSKNGFKFLTGDSKEDATRIMYFDLMTFRDGE